MLPDQVAELPARSPDLHRVIESPHNLLHNAFRKRLRENANVRTVMEAVTLLKKVANEVITRKYIRSLVKGMRDTYPSVEERKGDCAEKPYR